VIALRDVANGVDESLSVKLVFGGANEQTRARMTERIKKINQRTDLQ
jgi:uncharacterized phage protein gp47/JayE